VKEVLAYNETHSASPIVLVSEKWILECIASNARVKEAAYTHDAVTSPPQSVATTVSDPPTSRQKRGSKRDRRASGNQVSLYIERPVSNVQAVNIDEDNVSSPPSHSLSKKKARHHLPASII
jgi:hypothetical protein